MKKFIYFQFSMPLFIAFLISSGLAFAQVGEKADMHKLKIQTSAYSWMCKSKIESKVNDLKGVTDAVLSMESKILTVKFDANSISTEDIKNTIVKMGYEADVISDDNETSGKKGLKKLINGTVIGMDNNGKDFPLIKASIQIVGTNRGTLSNKSGKFEIIIPGNDARITVSYAGYIKDTVNVRAGDDDIIIKLKPISTAVVNVYDKQPDLLINNASIFKQEIITEKGLQKAACCNLSESFQANPSVDINFSDALTGAKQIQLLGLGGVYSQLLMEKIPSMRGLASNFGLSYVPGPWMESIQISKGAASVATGYESISGQINVEIKKPENVEPLYFNLYGDNTSRFESTLNLVKKINDRVSTMFLLHANSSQNKFDDNNDLFIDQPLVNQINVINRWLYQGDIWHNFTSFKALDEQRKGGQGRFFSSNDSGLYAIDIKTRRYEFSTKNGLVFPGIKYKSLAAIFSATHHKQESYYGPRNFNAEQNSAYLNLIYQSSLDTPVPGVKNAESGEISGAIPAVHNYNFGASLQYDNFIEIFSDSLMRRYEQVPGAFLEYTYTGITDLTLAGGVRIDNHNKFGSFVTPRFHLRYQLNPENIFRASAGKGWRTTDVYSENSQLFNSSRKFVVKENLIPEQAWNYGINTHHEFFFLDMLTSLNFEYYRTDFKNQVIVDLDKNEDEVNFYNLKGVSYSNSFQVDITGEPYYGLTFMLAYRLNDVKSTYNGKLETKPLVSRDRGFLNLIYSTPDDSWSFDATIDINGGGRLPRTNGNPVEYQLGDRYPSFTQLHGQVTKRFDKWEFYLGAENLTNFRQKNPILAYDKPFSPYFDSSIIWGPVLGRKVYFGMRVKVL